MSPFENNFGSVQEGPSSPLLQPIHGISLYDYAALCFKISSGANADAVIAAFGIDNVVWDEVNTLWGKRMQEDTTFSVTTLFGQYFQSAANHPKLQNMNNGSSGLSEKGKENLERLKRDRYFYEELSAARSAASDYGIDGAQWIEDNYGVNLGDFQSVAMMYMNQDNQDGQVNRHHYALYMRDMMEKYKEIFAKEQGGNIADDIEF